MFASISKEKKLYYLPVVICLLCVVLLAFLPTLVIQLVKVLCDLRRGK